MRTDKQHFTNIVWDFIRRMKIPREMGGKSDGGYQIFQQFGDELVKELRKMNCRTLGLIAACGGGSSADDCGGQIPMAQVVPKEFRLMIEHSGRTTLTQLALASLIAGIWGALTGEAYRAQREDLDFEPLLREWLLHPGLAASLSRDPYPGE